MLIGDVAPEDARLKSILHGDQLHFVRNTRQLEEALDAPPPFDLGIVCLQFDESRMFETLRAIRTRERRLPVACIRGDSAAHVLNVERYREPVASAGGDALIDLTAVPNGAAGNDHVRRQLYGCIPRGDRMRSTSVYTRTLHAASDVAGGRHQLARFLSAHPDDVDDWMSGADFPPYAAYMAALDVASHAAAPGINVIPAPRPRMN